MSEYPHHIRVTRPGPIVGQDPDTGQPEYGEEGLLYDGPADVQDAGEVLARSPDGTPTEMSDATVFLPETAPLSAIMEEDHVLIDWNDGSPTDDAQVAKRRRLDGSLLLKYV